MTMRDPGALTELVQTRFRTCGTRIRFLVLENFSYSGVRLARGSLGFRE
jgi:hypothetical protein